MRYLVFCILLVAWFAGCSDPSIAPPGDAIDDVCRLEGVVCDGDVRISGLDRRAPANETAVAFDSLNGSVLIEDADLIAVGDVVRLNASACLDCELMVRNTSLQVLQSPPGTPPGVAIHAVGFRQVELVNVTISMPAGGDGLWEPPYRIITDGYDAVELVGDIGRLQLDDVRIRSNGTSGTAIAHHGGVIGSLRMHGLHVDGFGAGVTAQADDVAISGVYVHCAEGNYTLGLMVRASAGVVSESVIDRCHEGLRVSGVDDFVARGVTVFDGSLGFDLRTPTGSGNSHALVEGVSLEGQGMVGIRVSGVDLDVRNSSFGRVGHRWTAAEGPAEGHGAIVLANAGGSVRGSHFSHARPYAIAYSVGGLVLNAASGDSFEASGNRWTGPEPTLMPVGVPDTILEMAPGNHFTESVYMMP